MERKLISGRGLDDKIWAIVLVALVLLAPVKDYYEHNLGAFDFWWVLTGSTFSGYFIYRTFTKIYPVYYDENFIYWKNKGEEFKIDFLQIESFSAFDYYRQTPWVELNYYDANNMIRQIIFLSPDKSKLLEFEQSAQIKRPGFKILGNDKLLDMARDNARKRNSR